MAKEPTVEVVEAEEVSDPGTAVAVQEARGVLALTPEDLAEAREIIQANMGAGITEFDLERIKVPAGGGVTWEVPNMETGELEALPEISGVIVAKKTVRAFWREPFDKTGGGTPPDCYSDDSVTGQGDPGVACARCKFSQFGTAITASGQQAPGQACKQMEILFMLRGDGILPTVVAAPPTSLKPLRSYFLRLASQRTKYNHAVTALRLERQKNKAGINYAQIQPRMVGKLPPEMVRTVEAYGAELAPLMNRQVIVDTVAEAVDAYQNEPAD